MAVTRSFRDSDNIANNPKIAHSLKLTNWHSMSLEQIQELHESGAMAVEAIAHDRSVLETVTTGLKAVKNKLLSQAGDLKRLHEDNKPNEGFVVAKTFAATKAEYEALKGQLEALCLKYNCDSEMIAEIIEEAGSMAEARRIVQNKQVHDLYIQRKAEKAAADQARLRKEVASGQFEAELAALLGEGIELVAIPEVPEQQAEGLATQPIGDFSQPLKEMAAKSRKTAKA